MKRAVAAILMAVLCLAPAVARAAVNDLDSFLHELDQRRPQIADITATFRQAKYAALFEDTKVSSGEFVYRAPVDMLWKYEKPDQSFLRVSADDVRFYFPLLEQIEVYPLDDKRNMTSLMSSFNQDSAQLRKQYEITFLPRGSAKLDFAGEAVAFPESPGIRLVPTDEGLAAQFSQIELWVEPDSFVPCAIIITEPTGDRTTFLFSDIHTNSGVDDAALAFHAPPGTDVVYVGEQS